MKTRLLLCVVLCAVVMLTLAGCGAKADGKADENKPMSEVKAEAETMSVGKLKATAMTYKRAIGAKKPELQKLKMVLRALPRNRLASAEVKPIKADVDDLKKSIAALRERFDVYHGKLVELKADVSGLKI